jgi:hypothetical protein
LPRPRPSWPICAKARRRSQAGSDNRRRTTGWVLRCATDGPPRFVILNKVKDPSQKLRQSAVDCRSRRGAVLLRPLRKGATRSRPYQGAPAPAPAPPALVDGQNRNAAGRQRAAGSFAALRMTDFPDRVHSWEPPKVRVLVGCLRMTTTDPCDLTNVRSAALLLTEPRRIR